MAANWQGTAEKVATYYNIAKNLYNQFTKIGTFGPIVFETSDSKVLNFKDLTRAGGSKWATHDLIQGKPRVQYLAPKLRTVTFTIKLSSQHGVRPRATLEKLMNMAESPMAYNLVIGGRPLGDNPWRLTDVSESWGHMYNRGELINADVALTLEEYV